MLKKLLLTSSLLASSLYAINTKDDLTLKMIQEVIPSTKIVKYEPAQIDGLYKVFTPNNQLFYVYPFKKLIVFGEIWTNNGYSFTKNDRNKFMKENLKKDTEQKLKANHEELTKYSITAKTSKNNKYELIVFTDPLCPFCIKLDNYLENKDINVKFNYLFEVHHEYAKELATAVFNVGENIKPKLIHDITEIGLKMLKTNKQLSKDEVVDLLKKYNLKIDDTLKTTEFDYIDDLAKKVNISGTPNIFVYDKNAKKIIDFVIGANVKKLSKYLKK